jgi:hypothetical protein
MYDAVLKLSLCSARGHMYDAQRLQSEHTRDSTTPLRKVLIANKHGVRPDRAPDDMIELYINSRGGLPKLALHIT